MIFGFNPGKRSRNSVALFVQSFLLFFELGVQIKFCRVHENRVDRPDRARHGQSGAFGDHPIFQAAAEDRVENAHRVGQIDVAEVLAFADPAGVQQVAVDVRVALQDVVEQVGVLCAVAGDERIVEEFVLDLAGLGRIAGRRLHRLAEHHEGRRLFVGQFGDGGDDAAAGDEEEVIDPLGVDVVAGVHEVAAFDDRPAVGGHFHVVEIEACRRPRRRRFPERCLRLRQA